MNARLQANLLRFAIVRCPRHMKHPPASITAPEPQLRRAFTDEATRLAQFDQSARTRNGKVAEFIHHQEQSK